MSDPRPDLVLHLALGAALANNGARQALSTLPANLLCVGPLAELWTGVVRCEQDRVTQIVGRLIGARIGPHDKIRPLDAILREAERQADEFRIEAVSRRAALAKRVNPLEYAAELERLASELRAAASKKETA